MIDLIITFVAISLLLVSIEVAWDTHTWKKWGKIWHGVGIAMWSIFLLIALWATDWNSWALGLGGMRVAWFNRMMATKAFNKPWYWIGTTGIDGYVRKFLAKFANNSPSKKDVTLLKRWSYTVGTVGMAGVVMFILTESQII